METDVLKVVGRGVGVENVESCWELTVGGCDFPIDIGYWWFEGGNYWRDWIKRCQ